MAGLHVLVVNMWQNLPYVLHIEVRAGPFTIHARCRLKESRSRSLE